MREQYRHIMLLFYSPALVQLIVTLQSAQLLSAIDMSLCYSLFHIKGIFGFLLLVYTINLSLSTDLVEPPPMGTFYMKHALCIYNIVIYLYYVFVTL